MPDSDTDFTKGQHLDGPTEPSSSQTWISPGPAASSASQEPQRSVINVLILKLIVKEEKKKPIHLTITVWEREIETEFLYEAQVGLELAL